MNIECRPASQNSDWDGEAALREVAAAVPPGWRLLAGCALQGGSTPGAGRSDAVLAHPEIGVALLGAAPLADAVDELKRALDATGFRDVFGGYPPIVQRVPPPPGLALGEVLDAAFSLEPPLALTPPAGADWVQAVSDALATARAGLAVPERRDAQPLVPVAGGAEERPAKPVLALTGAGEERRPFRKPVWPMVGCFALGMLGGAALVLHIAKPPEPAMARPPGAERLAASPGDGAFPGPESSSAGADSRPTPNIGPVELPNRADAVAEDAAAPATAAPGHGGAPTEAPSSTGSAAGPAEDPPEAQQGAVVPAPAAPVPASDRGVPESAPPHGIAEVTRETASVGEAPPAVEAETTAPAAPADRPAPPVGNAEAMEGHRPAPSDAAPAPAQEPSVARAGDPPVSSEGTRTSHDQVPHNGDSAPRRTAPPADAEQPDMLSGQRSPDAPRQDFLPPTAQSEGDSARLLEAPSGPAAPPPPTPRSEEPAPARAAQAPVARPTEPEQRAATAPDRGAEPPLPEGGQPAAPSGAPAPPAPGPSPAERPAAAAAQGAGRAAPAAATPPDMLGLLLRRGDAARAQGDLAAARLLYGRAAEAGNAAAALAVGKTFDPDFLHSQRAAGLQPQPAAAAAWYRRAAALGDPDAPALLRKLNDKYGPMP